MDVISLREPGVVKVNSVVERPCRPSQDHLIAFAVRFNRKPSHTGAITFFPALKLANHRRFLEAIQPTFPTASPPREYKSLIPIQSTNKPPSNSTQTLAHDARFDHPMSQITPISRVEANRLFPVLLHGFIAGQPGSDEPACWLCAPEAR